MKETVLKTELPDVPLLRRGKVRDIYQAGEDLLIVSTDRISAFDCILPNGIPDKGTVLTGLAGFWFARMEDIIPNHLISCNVDDFPPALQKYADVLEGRSVLVRKTEVVPIECVVRGYLAGSGWKEYKQDGTVCGVSLPDGLQQASPLPEPVFTPSTKAESGHDENISVEKMKDLVGESVTGRLRDVSLAVYRRAREYAESRGIIIADTKFEFGKTADGIILIDEILTPDSSRFWPRETYSPGQSPPSYDKQFVRDYLETLDWDKTPPAPELPEEVIRKTAEKYREAYQKLSGSPLA